VKRRRRQKPIVIPGDGDPCPRCGVPMQIREPAGVGDRQQRQLFSYTRWFCCMNKQCKTTLVMPARYKVAM
jgi:hypothetical protein